MKQNVHLTISLIALHSMTSQAAVIAWGPATAISTGLGNSSDVSTTGTLVEAFNAVGNDQIATATTVTVNGIDFAPTTSLLGSDPRNGGGNDFSSTTNSGDPAYDTLLSTLEYGGGTALVTIGIGDGDGNTAVNGSGLLTIGETYQIQIWYSDTRAGQDARIMTFGDGTTMPNTIGLNDQFTIGTFTADGTTQTLTLASGTPEGIGSNFGQSHINAYQIRLIPEPSSTLLLGLSSLALLTRRRRS